MPLGHNRILGDASKAAEARPHRVAMANWPASIKDPRTQTLDALLNHISRSGYEGTEFGLGAFAKYFPGDSPLVAARKARRELERRGLANFGSTLHVSDDAMRQLNWLKRISEQIELAGELGGQFASYQVNLHRDYLNTGGLYREDEAYLQWCADRVAELREETWRLGMNFYLEVHVDRITEDPAALVRIMQMCDCELNGDMSHYLSRGIKRGRHVERILSRVGHTHVRMARVYGDLSAAVTDPQADWCAKGVTWQMFEFMKPALAGGLSSRTICGETGPMHLVTDTLTQDAALVPLYRAFARYADASAQGIVPKVDEPGDLAIRF